MLWLQSLHGNTLFLCLLSCGTRRWKSGKFYGPRIGWGMGTAGHSSKSDREDALLCEGNSLMRRITKIFCLHTLIFVFEAGPLVLRLFHCCLNFRAILDPTFLRKHHHAETDHKYLLRLHACLCSLCVFLTPPPFLKLNNVTKS